MIRKLSYVVFVLLLASPAFSQGTEEIEDLFVVRTRTEGTVAPSASIRASMNRMGAAIFNDGHTGKVKIVVEMEANTITKEKIVFVEGTEKEFEDLHRRAAMDLLDEAFAHVRANGDANGNGEIKVVVAGKK